MHSLAIINPLFQTQSFIFIGWNITQQIQLQKTQLLPEEIYSSVNQFNISWLEKKNSFPASGY